MLPLLRQIARVVRNVIGVPDYERYLTHMRVHHPGLPALDRDTFARDALSRRYDRPGSRCC